MGSDGTIKASTPSRHFDPVRDHLIGWLAYKEAKAVSGLANLPPPRRSPTENHCVNESRFASEIRLPGWLPPGLCGCLPIGDPPNKSPLRSWSSILHSVIVSG